MKRILLLLIVFLQFSSMSFARDGGGDTVDAAAVTNGGYQSSVNSSASTQKQVIGMAQSTSSNLFNKGKKMLKRSFGANPMGWLYIAASVFASKKGKEIYGDGVDNSSLACQFSTDSTCGQQTTSKSNYAGASAPVLDDQTNKQVSDLAKEYGGSYDSSTGTITTSSGQQISPDALKSDSAMAAAGLSAKDIADLKADMKNGGKNGIAGDGSDYDTAGIGVGAHGSAADGGGGAGSALGAMGRNGAGDRGPASATNGGGTQIVDLNGGRGANCGFFCSISDSYTMHWQKKGDLDPNLKGQ